MRSAMHRLGRGLYRLVRDVLRYLTFRFSCFRGIYKSFRQAEAAAPSNRIGYNHRDLALSYRAELEVRLDSSDYPVLYHLKRIRTESSIVFDFGGNIGVHYLRYRRYLSLENAKWIVCDVPEITRVGRDACVDMPNVLFVNDIADLNEPRIDILLATSSMQYVESPARLLSEMIDRGVRPAHILIDQVPLYDGEQFVTLQNGGPVYYPLNVFNRDEFISVITDFGYDLVDSWTNCNYSCAIPFHPEKSVPAYSGLCFSDKGSRGEPASF